MSRTYHHGRWNLERRFGTAAYQRWWANEPKWWRKLHKHRPRRSAVRRAVTEVMQSGDCDPTKFPLDKKPWYYYW